MKKLFLFPLIFFCIAANAKDYYVSANGDDANDGTSPSTPWRTIAKINKTKFLPGDSIFFKRGNVWREQLTIASSGTTGHPITFSAYGTGAKPIITGADPLSIGWVSYGSHIWGNRSTNAVSSRTMVIIEDSIYSEVASIDALSSSGKYFIKTNAAPDSVFIYSVSDPNSRKIEVSKREFCIVSTAGNLVHDINIVGIECRYAGNSGIAFYGIQDGPQFTGHCIVDSCNLYANRVNGCIAYNGHAGNIFRNSKATYNGNGFYSWISDNLTVSHCSTAHNIKYFISPNITDGHGCGAYQSNNILVENCESNDDWYGINVDVNGFAKNAILRYNYIHDSKTGTSGIGAGDGLAPGGIIKIYYNVIINCGGKLGSSYESFGKNTGIIQVYNNTMYNNSLNGGGGTIFLEHGNGFEIKNNVIASEYVDYTSPYLILHSTLPLSDHNQFYQYNLGASSTPFYYNGLTKNSLSSWISATGLDTHSQNSDLLFIDRNSDWRLQSNSPCINKGVNVGLTRDILGDSIVGLPDMGAYEYQNIGPVANAGSNQITTLPQNTLNLSGSGIDPDGNISSYRWSKISGPPSGTIVNSNLPITTVTGLIHGTYEFELKVTDNNGAIARDSIQVTVNSANILPVSNAGPDQSIFLPTHMVFLSGNGRDEDGTIVNYNWTKLSGPSAYYITNPISSATSVSGLVQGAYKFVLKVTDDNGAIGLDTVQINVLAGVLPLNLLTFRGQSLSGKVNLLWKTSSEKNTGGFHIEKKIKNTWTRIGYVKSAADGLSDKDYLFDDYQPAPGVNFYRLKIMDLNGDFTYSDIITVDSKVTESLVYQNMPNPFKDITTIQYAISERNIVKIIVYSGEGVRVAVLVNEIKQPGSYQVQWNAASFPSGNYFYKVFIGDKITTRKMLKIN